MSQAGIEVLDHSTQIQVILPQAPANPQVLGTASGIQVIAGGAGVINFAGGAIQMPPVELLATASGTQTLTAAQTVNAVGNLYINGLLQPYGQASFSGTTITLPPSLGILAGDFISVFYS